jgi:EpsI family protein
MAGIFQQQAPKVLTIVLLAQAAVFYSYSRGEHIPSEKPLASFEIPSARWTPIRELPIDDETRQVLNADDTLWRAYRNRETGDVLSLFVAYFASQRTGKTPHSPKNCLPGSGWTPSEAGTIKISQSSESGPITVNRYVVSRGENQSVVLYWYQGHGRVIASEYEAKIYTVLDSFRYKRSDTSLIRVVQMVVEGNTQRATDEAVSFVKAFFQPLREYLPG